MPTTVNSGVNTYTPSVPADQLIKFLVAGTVVAQSTDSGGNGHADGTGAGGGAWVQITRTVTANEIWQVQIQHPGDIASIVLNSGAGATVLSGDCGDNAGPGIGGQASACVGDIKHSGGNGGAAVAGAGGGGGGAGTVDGDGVNGADATLGTPGAGGLDGSGNVSGGAGGDVAPGAAGVTPGGGGGGDGGAGAGAGGDGRIVVYFGIPVNTVKLLSDGLTVQLDIGPNNNNWGVLNDSVIPNLTVHSSARGNLSAAYSSTFQSSDHKHMFVNYVVIGTPIIPSDTVTIPSLNAAVLSDPNIGNLPIVNFSATNGSTIAAPSTTAKQRAFELDLL